MKTYTIQFLQYGEKPESVNEDMYTLHAEHTGELDGQEEWECTVTPQPNNEPYAVLDYIKDMYDIVAYSMKVDGKEVCTDETERLCHLCDSTMDNKWCTNETCADYQ